MTFCVGFTGTEIGGGMNELQVAEVRALLVEELEQRGELLARHGDCIGADAQFHDVCLELGVPVVIHPPINLRKRANCAGALRLEPAKDYLDRNDDIARLCDLLIAAPRESREVVRSGVWATIRCGRKYRKSVAIVYPCGDTEIEVED